MTATRRIRRIRPTGGMRPPQGARSTVSHQESRSRREVSSPRCDGPEERKRCHRLVVSKSVKTV